MRDFCTYKRMMARAPSRFNLSWPASRPSPCSSVPAAAESAIGLTNTPRPNWIACDGVEVLARTLARAGRLN